MLHYCAHCGSPRIYQSGAYQWSCATCLGSFPVPLSLQPRNLPTYRPASSGTVVNLVLDAVLGLGHMLVLLCVAIFYVLVAIVLGSIG